MATLPGYLTQARHASAMISALLIIAALAAFVAADGQSSG